MLNGRQIKVGNSLMNVRYDITKGRLLFVQFSRNGEYRLFILTNLSTARAGTFQTTEPIPKATGIPVKSSSTIEVIIG